MERKDRVKTDYQIFMTTGNSTNQIHERLDHNDALLVTLKEAGRLLGGIGQTKVYDLLNKRELPFVKIGRCVRIELVAIQAFIDRQRIGSSPCINR
jgi:excisionase family DNA binding protein